MERKDGKNPVRAPIEIAVGEKLQAVGMVHRVLGQSAEELRKIEGGLDLLNARRIVPEKTVEPSVDPEAIPRPIEPAAQRHLRLVERIGLGPLLLHPAVDLLPLGGGPSVPGVAIDASAAGNRQGEIEQSDGEDLRLRTHVRL